MRRLRTCVHSLRPLIPFVLLISGVAVFFGLTIHRSAKSPPMSADHNVCWDQSIKIGVVPAGTCRSVYINATANSLFLLSIVFLLFFNFADQILRAFGDISSALVALDGRGNPRPNEVCKTPSSAESDDELIEHSPPSISQQFLFHGMFRLIRAAGTGFATFYSAYILFMYLNDSYHELLVVQSMLSIMQLCLFLYVSAMFNRKTEALDTLYRYPELPKHTVYATVSDWSLMPGIISVSVTKIFGSIVLGMILFKLMFNFVLEISCSHGTNDWRTFMFVLSDIVDLFVIVGLDGLSFASRSGGNPIAMGCRSLMARILAYFRGIRSKAPTTSTSTLLIHTAIAIGTCGLWYGLMFGLVKSTDQRVC